MNDRIKRILAYVQENELFPEDTKIEIDPFDDNLPEPIRVAKRITDYMLAQPLILRDDSELAGLTQFRSGCPAPADLFPRSGHMCAYAAMLR
ncbi:MAG: hypothetical protein J5833_00125, partial [Victivallales bacterium]|nr:hypothetical protein [Victivallales bacterium]